eukprot:1683410-Pyramimonas_sp.AAC.1
MPKAIAGSAVCPKIIILIILTTPIVAPLATLLASYSLLTRFLLASYSLLTNFLLASHSLLTRQMLVRTRNAINVMNNKEMAVYFKDTVTMLPVPVPPSTDMIESEFSNDVLLAARLVQHHFRHFQVRLI